MVDLISVFSFSRAESCLSPKAFFIITGEIMIWKCHHYVVSLIDASISLYKQYVFMSFQHLSQTPINCMAYVCWTESYHLKRRQWRRKTQLSDITILFLRLEVKKYSCAKEIAGKDTLGCILAPGGWVYILKRDDHYTFFLRKQKEGHWCKTSPNNSIGGSVSLTFPLSVKHISFLLFASLIWEDFFPPSEA